MRMMPATVCSTFHVSEIALTTSRLTDWVMVWLSKQPSWSQTRNVQISTRNFNLQSNAVLIEGEDEDPLSAVVKNDRKLTYLPSVSSTFSMWYKRRWIRVTRNIRDGYYGRREESLELWFVSFFYHLKRVLNDHILASCRGVTKSSISCCWRPRRNIWLPRNTQFRFMSLTRKSPVLHPA